MSAAGSSQTPQRTPASAYDVIPMRGLATFEHPLALVAGDDLVERLPQRVGEALGVRLVGVAFEGGRQLQLVLDPVEAGGEQGREGQVRVDVASGDARLRSELLPVADDAEAAGPV